MIYPVCKKQTFSGVMLWVSALQSTLHSSFPVLAQTALAIFTICLMEELYQEFNFWNPNESELSTLLIYLILTVTI